jgi:hypothetical protein
MRQPRQHGSRPGAAATPRASMRHAALSLRAHTPLRTLACPAPAPAPPRPQTHGLAPARAQ